MFDLNGKNAYVTGAAGGIGLAVAKRFHQAGAKVVITDLISEPLDPERRVLDGHATRHRARGPRPYADQHGAAQPPERGDRALRQRRLHFSSVRGPLGVDFGYDETLNDGYWNPADQGVERIEAAEGSAPKCSRRWSSIG